MSENVRQINKDHPAMIDLSISCDRLNSGSVEVKEWLEARAKEHDLELLLAHADDGIIWGRSEGGKLITSGEVVRTNQAMQRSAKDEIEAAQEVCPMLMTETLQQARLFAKDGELLLWRDGDNQFRARLIRDAKSGEEDATWDEYFDEPQMLWGTNGVVTIDDFTLLRDGAQGLRHVVPLPIKLGDKGSVTPLNLIVRHYINKEKEGFARVVASRLVSLEETK